MAAGDLTEGRAAEGYDDFFGSSDPTWWMLRPEKKEGASGPLWLTRHPGADHHGSLADGHEVTEHEDGTISVYPSILCRACGWHGYLERGVWREV